MVNLSVDGPLGVWELLLPLQLLKLLRRPLSSSIIEEAEKVLSSFLF